MTPPDSRAPFRMMIAGEFTDGSTAREIAASLAKWAPPA